MYNLTMLLLATNLSKLTDWAFCIAGNELYLREWIQFYIGSGCWGTCAAQRGYKQRLHWPPDGWKSPHVVTRRTVFNHGRHRTTQGP